LALSSASLPLAVFFEARFTVLLYYAIRVLASNWKEAISGVELRRFQVVSGLSSPPLCNRSGSLRFHSPNSAS
jgi:hypothetical protein